MLFVVSSNADKADPATRKLIRSHAMLGKKKKKKKERPNPDRRVTRLTPAHISPVGLEEVIETFRPLLPGRVGSDLSFVDFAEELQPSTAINIAKCSTIAKRVMFPLMMAIGLQSDSEEALYPPGTDSAALHITAFTVEEFIRRVLRRQQNGVEPMSMLHLQRGLRLLRERLVGQEGDPKISDSTIGIVMKLSGVAHFEGDHAASKHHMEGLRQMVDLRGGLDFFKGRFMLTEMLRCDLRVALLDESTPVFFRQPWEPVPEYPKKLLPGSDSKTNSEDNDGLIEQLDNGLAMTWRVMRRFCLIVNLGTQTQWPIYTEVIHETMVSVTYRLLFMEFPTGSLDEAVRLGLLGFSHHVFLQWQDVKTPHSDFLATYQGCVRKLGLVDGVTSQLRLWLLMTAAIALFDISGNAWLEEGLRECVRGCRVETWKQMQELLKSFMWIPLLDEQSGMQIYDSLFPQQEK